MSRNGSPNVFAFIMGKLAIFILKWLFIFGALSAGAGYLILSDIGSQIGPVQSLKESARLKISAFIPDSLKGAPAAGAVPAASPSPVAGPASKPSAAAPKPDASPAPKAVGEAASKGAPDVASGSGFLDFPEYGIGFFYDPQGAPSKISQAEVLSLLSKAGAVWLEGCGARFEFKGVRHADYVDGAKTLPDKTGVVVWQGDLGERAIGRAHMGGESGPAAGFVLSLESSYFSQDSSQLDMTLVHEMGHVLGLPHSSNPKSVMYPESRRGQRPLEGDLAMCRYLRARWSGMGRQAAQDKYGVLLN